MLRTLTQSSSQSTTRNNVIRFIQRKGTAFLLLSLCVLWGCSSMTAEQKAISVLDKWCDCVQEHRSMGEQEALSLCTARYREDLDALMRQKLSETQAKLQEEPNLDVSDSLGNFLRAKHFESMDVMMKEKARSCLK